mmetsp:Transcript_33859/g.62718  ORF Transcript_33859/g.62718 Transcript_33859/m.62718 type:complete len:110 (+) Transcript_33859:111-440(+)
MCFQYPCCRFCVGRGQASPHKSMLNAGVMTAGMFGLVLSSLDIAGLNASPLLSLPLLSPRSALSAHKPPKQSPAAHKYAPNAKRLLQMITQNGRPLPTSLGEGSKAVRK